MASVDRQAELKKHLERAERILAADHFAALGLPRTAGPDEAQKAFVEAAKQWHPDRVPSEARELAPLYARVFSRLEVARGTLTDPQRRQRYIEELFSPPKQATSADATGLEASLELKKAEVLLKKNDLATAEKHLRRVIHLTPGNVLAQALLVWVQVKPTSQPAELAKLVTDLDRVVALDGKCERAFFFRGQLRKRLGKEKEAHADFVRAAELDKTNIDAQREVRLYRMRHEKSADQPADKSPSSGVGQFFQKLFKR
jgi:tetratricopeptide (TPR) repeat protein